MGSLRCQLLLKHGRQLHGVQFGLGRSGREPQLNARPLAKLATNLNRAAMLLNNLLHNAEPQAGAVRACGKERVKDMRKISCGDAMSSVPNRYDEYPWRAIVDFWGRRRY